jgi:hypothetical protein
MMKHLGETKERNQKGKMPLYIVCLYTLINGTTGLQDT